MITKPDRMDSDRLWEGFWAVHLLEIGHRLDLLEAFRGWQTPQDAAEHAGLELPHLDGWCAALAELGLMERSPSDSYRFPPEQLPNLLRGRALVSCHLALASRTLETATAILSGRALPEPPIAARTLLLESLKANYRWLYETVSSEVPELQSRLEEAQRVLEVGCGLGVGLTELRARFPHLELFGLEADYECAKESERTNRCVIHVGSSPKKAFGQPFDAIVCFRVLAGTPEPLELIRECAELLVDGGWLILGSELPAIDREDKSAGRALSEQFTHQLLAGEARLAPLEERELLEAANSNGLSLQHRTLGPDWATPLFLFTNS